MQGSRRVRTTCRSNLCSGPIDSLRFGCSLHVDMLVVREVYACLLRSRNQRPIANQPLDSEKNARRIVDLLKRTKTKKNKSARAAARNPSPSQHKGRPHTAPGVIAKLIDPGSHFFELGINAAFECTRNGSARRARNRHRTPRKSFAVELSWLSLTTRL